MVWIAHRPVSPEHKTERYPEALPEWVQSRTRVDNSFQRLRSATQIVEHRDLAQHDWIVRCVLLQGKEVFFSVRKVFLNQLDAGEQNSSWNVPGLSERTLRTSERAPAVSPLFRRISARPTRGGRYPPLMAIDF
jgi:hypothetical protein